MTEDLRRGNRLGKYELLLRIGRGGMATVWVARERTEHQESDRLVAVKAILADLAGDPEFTKMFLDEGRLVQRIRQNNVVDVYEVGEHNGVMYMAMEWVEGDSLHAIIAEAGKRRPIPPDMAVRIVADTAAGLHAAHQVKDDEGNLLNVVHRDVSPHNILIGTDGAVKLVDFGVAKAMGRLSDATSAGQLKGKFGYMSPEQAMAKAVDTRSDLFSLGIVLFELTTGRRLFRGQHDAETLHLVVSGQIPKPSSIDEHYPPKLEAIVLKALERDPDKRYQTAEEFQKALEQYLRDQTTVVPRAGIGALLKRVLGVRIEQRRKAVRAALKTIDGGVSTPGLIPGDPAFIGNHGDGSHSGVSQVSHVGLAPGSHSGISGVGANGVTVGPQTVSQVAPAPRKGGMLGYVFGVVGLLVALGVVLMLVFNPRRTTTTIVNVPAAAPDQPRPAEPKSPAKPTALDPNVPTLDVENLAAAEDAGKSAGARRVPPKAGARPTPAVTPKATAPAQATPPSNTSLPRKNPYE